MSSRDRILSAIKANKPALNPLPERINVGPKHVEPAAILAQFRTILQAVGSPVVEVMDYDEIRAHVRETFPDSTNTAVMVPDLQDLADFSLAVLDPHDLELVNLAILPGRLGVGENGAVWLTEAEAGHRVLPFITQHLALVLPQSGLVATMHEAYEHIQVDEKGFGVFIAGPSKTADIEQSLVIGAHGARSLVVYVLKNA